ncbi:MAG: hypothetical protein Q8P48_07825 [Deltaproteobacteria bacterium]|nr:hypothetical protein [Deltaproteobacteria bacterium]
MERLRRQFIAGILLSTLLYIFPSHAASGQPEKAHFSRWEFELPPQLKKTEQTGERLVLKLHSATGAGQSATITLYAPQPVQGDPSEWLDGQWQRLSAGHAIVFDAPQNEAALMDGTPGLRRSANTGNGEVFLQADAYIDGDRAYVMVVESEGEQGMQAYLTFHMGLSLAFAGEAPPTGPLPAPLEPVATTADFADITPYRPLGPDLFDTIDLNGPDEVIRTSADLDEVSVNDALDSFLKDNQDLLGDVQGSPMTFASAMVKVRALVGVDRNAGYLDTLRAHPQLQGPDALMHYAVAQLMAGFVPEALSSLLVAHERWPGDTLVMFNLASVLSEYGFVNESQAILGEIRRLGRPPEVAPGFTSKSAMDYVRGYNETRLGQYDAAAKTLKDVAENEPYLAEAALTLALLEDRLGRDPRQLFLKGYYRRSAKFMKPGQAERKESPGTDENQPEQDEEIPVEEMEEDFAALPAIYFVDLSKGQPGSLRKVKRPEGLDEAIAFYYWYAKMIPVFDAQIASLVETRDRLRGRWSRNIAPGPRIERYEAILRIFSEANARLPELHALVKDRNEASNELADSDDLLAVMEAIVEIGREIARRRPPPSPCPKIMALVSRAHAARLERVKKVEVATRRAHHLWRLYATALGGMASDPDFRAYIKADVELADAVVYYGLVANMFEAAKYSPAAEECIALERRAAEEAEKQDEVDLAPCDDKNKVTKGLKLGPFKFEKSCEGATLAIENDLLEVLKLTAEANFDKDGWLKGHKIGATAGNDNLKVSVEVTTDKGGDFVEGKVGVEGGVGPGKVKGEVSRDSKGNTTIYGGKKTGGEVGAGPVKAGASHEEGGGYTVNSKGQVTSTFTKTVTESSAEVAKVGVSSRTESVTVVPGPGVSRGAPTLSVY